MPDSLRRTRTPHPKGPGTAIADLPRPEGQAHRAPHRPLGVPVLHGHSHLTLPTLAEIVLNLKAHHRVLLNLLGERYVAAYANYG